MICFIQSDLWKTEGLVVIRRLQWYHVYIRIKVEREEDRDGSQKL